MKKNIIRLGISKILKNDKELRIDNQYYLKNRLVEVNLDKLSDFILTMRGVLDRLDTQTIMDIRKKINYL